VRQTTSPGATTANGLCEGRARSRPTLTGCSAMAQTHGRCFPVPTQAATSTPGNASAFARAEMPQSHTSSRSAVQPDVRRLLYLTTCSAVLATAGIQQQQPPSCFSSIPARAKRSHFQTIEQVQRSYVSLCGKSPISPRARARTPHACATARNAHFPTHGAEPSALGESRAGARPGGR